MYVFVVLTHLSEALGKGWLSKGIAAVTQMVKYPSCSSGWQMARQKMFKVIQVAVQLGLIFTKMSNTD